MAKIVRIMFSFVFTVFGGLSGYSIALYTQSFYDPLSSVGRATNFGAFILLGLLLGLTLAPPFSRGVMKAVDYFAVSLQRLSVQEILMGSAGLLFGLIVAFFANLALRQIDFSSIPALGPYVGPFLIVLSTMFFALFGAFFGSRLVFIHSLADLLESGIGVRDWGTQRVVVDTSAILDGRLPALIDSGFLSGTLVVSRFVLDELQYKADAADPTARKKGRRGLDLLDEIQKEHKIKIETRTYENLTTVDAKLVQLSLDLKCPLLTNDFNLQKVASLQHVKVLNINSLASALRPIYSNGDELILEVVKPGRESGQGLAYLDDGTMVVVENGRRRVGQTVRSEISSIVQTASGRMLFAKYLETVEPKPNGERDPAQTPPSPPETAGTK